MDPGQLEEGSSQLGESNKRKAKGDPTSSSFKVTRVWINDRKKKKRTFSLRMVKPDIQSEVGADNITYPTVCLMEESADNEHGFHIMHNIDHKSILSMEILCENKVQSNDTASVATFVEPYEGLLWSRCAAPSCADLIYHIPSPRLQSYLRQIVMGLDFLRINDLYHGDLSWNSTLYHGDTVKLAGFRSKEPMSKAEAQWDDWLCFLQMLEQVSNQAARANETRPQDDKYYCGHLDSLINMMKRLDRTSLPIIKDIILEDYFFWDSARRHKFFMNTVSLKLTDTAFMKRLSKSSIRGKSWDTNCKSQFKQLVETMNEYREAQKKKSHKDRKGKDPEDENVEAYNGDSLRDYVRLVCGAYTHWRQIKVDVDSIIRHNHPTVCSDVKKILEASDSEDSPKGTNQFGGYGPQGYHPQDHGVASHYSQSQSGYSCYPGPPSRGSKAWDQRPGSSAHASYKGGVSDSYEHGCSQLPSYRPGPGDNLGMENLSIHGYGQSQVPPGYGQPLDPQHAIS